MRKNTSGTSIIEAMVVMLIVVTWIIWMYKIFNNSQNLSNTTQNRIVAIQIAREGIEAFTNIRDTNWILFAADHKNCWNTLNYDNSCVWNAGVSTNIAHNTSYKIYQTTENRWELARQSTWDYTNNWYRDRFEVFQYRDASPYAWLYTQSGATSEVESMQPLFTREIQVEYIEDGIATGFANSDEQKMIVTSKVQWQDPSKTTPHTVELETILTNWKNKVN